MPLLAAEIRDVMVDTVSRTGGHLGPSLGVVETTLAVHRVFDSPARQGAVGHRPPVLRPQAGDRPPEPLRHAAQEGRAVRLPEPQESEHDLVENSHASTALSYADGLAKAYRLRGEDRTSWPSSATARSPAACAGRR
jgi:1-deoxy-D-xylulose-5-phosphate synthase